MAKSRNPMPRSDRKSVTRAVRRRTREMMRDWGEDTEALLPRERRLNVFPCGCCIRYR